MPTFKGEVTSRLPARVVMADLMARVQAAVGFEVPLVGEHDPDTMAFTCFRWEYEAMTDMNAAIETAIISYSLADHEDDDFAATEKAQAAAQEAATAIQDTPSRLDALEARVAALEAKK